MSNRIDLNEVLNNTKMLRVLSKQDIKEYFSLRKSGFYDRNHWIPIDELENVHDTYASHYLLKSNNKSEACFRIVPADTKLNMPITEETEIALFRDSVAKKYISELSRLVINPKECRKMFWGTILSIGLESAKNNIPFQVALMEPSFIRLIYRYKFYPRVIGEPVELNGVRYPVVFNINDMLKLVRISQPDVYYAKFIKTHKSLKKFIHENKKEVSQVWEKFNVLQDTCQGLIPKAS